MIILAEEERYEVVPGFTGREALRRESLVDFGLRAFLATIALAQINVTVGDLEENRELPETVTMGFDETTVKRVMTMVDRSEYKRRQSPPGVRITPRAFGKDRRLPITNRFRSF
jgi:NH3-dependent NAD+ synthetase